MTDWTNHRFGKLVVLKFISKDLVKNRYYWECLCDCGIICLKEIADLKKSTSKSCGCLRRQSQSDAKRKPPGVAAFNNLYNTYKISCGDYREYVFELTKEDFKILLDGNCFYCGISPAQIKKGKYSNYIYNGIDRVDNSIGYTVKNSVSCCKACNSLKAGISKEMVFKLYDWFKKNE